MIIMPYKDFPSLVPSSDFIFNLNGLGDDS